MRSRFLNERASVIGWRVFSGILIVALAGLLVHPPAMAIDFRLGGKECSLMGYVNQGVSFGVAGDEYDTKQGFQSALFQFLLEAQIDLDPELRFFGSVGCNADWAYPILTSNSEWDDKEFDKSRDELFIYSHRRDILRELHVTWSPGNWFFRLGNQIAVWGETDVFRIMDQINPLDNRRGLTDLEFETTILPIWLVRAEYYLQPDSSWLNDLGFEFIFNPNADFRGDESDLGNDKAGIWSPKINVRLGLPYPFDLIHVGSFDMFLDRPDSFDDDGFEYGFRVRAVIQNTIVTLNAFYGRDNAPVARPRSALPRVQRSADDGRLILHLPMEGYYPLMRFVGFTLTRDFEKLYVSALGGIAPVLRLEAFYAFENTFETATSTFEKFDETRWAIGIDWKIWARWLNPRAAFMISPQFYHRKVLNYPSDGLTQSGVLVRDNNYQASLLISTSYFHNKIAPQCIWARNISERANLFKIQVIYERSDVWNYTLGTLLINGEKTGKGFEPFTNKDQIYFTVGYRF